MFYLVLYMILTITSNYLTNRYQSVGLRNGGRALVQYVGDSLAFNMAVG